MQHNQNDGQRQFAEHDGETGQITRYAAEFPSEFTPQREEEQNARRGHHESADGGQTGGSCQKENAEHSKNDGAAPGSYTQLEEKGRYYQLYTGNSIGA